MLAWMNEEAFRLTQATQIVHFWSRSRSALWKKGETSGNVLRVVELRLDCDGDAVLVRAEPAGPACHTGTTACFFRVLEGEHGEGAREDDGVPEPPVDGRVLDQLSQIIEARKRSTAEKSYTKSLLDGGPAKILAKIEEESGELCAELPAGGADKIAHEAADLLFHVLVGLSSRGVPLTDLWKTLRGRLGTSGHAEKAARGKPA